MDHKRALTILAVATVLVVVTAIVARQETTSTPKYEEKLFPELLGQINNTAEIIGTSKDGLFTLFARDGRWLVKEKHGYPANPDKVHQLLVGLSQLQRIEPKTNNPELYSKIGVEDVSVNGARSLRITLKSADGQVLADLLVGNRKFSKANPNLQEYFVRVAGEARAWLVEGKISDEKSVLNWLERDVLALDPGRVREVRVTHADGQEVVVQREDPSVADYKLVGLPDDAEVEPYTVNSIANGLTNLTLDDVKPAADLSFSGKRPLTVELITFDGLRVNMQSLKDGKQHLARFRAEFDSSSVAPSREGKNENKHAPETGLMKPDAVKKEVDTLNARWGDWVYVIPGYRIDSLTKKKSDLLKVSKGDS